MDQGSLVMERGDATNQFLENLEKSIRVVVAFWLKEREDGRGSFYIASDQFNRGRLGGAYGEVLRIAKEIKDLPFDPFQVKLVGLGEPTAQAALEFYKTHPSKIPF